MKRGWSGPKNFGNFADFICAFPLMSSLPLKAAWGGGLMMSKKYRAEKFKGIER